MKDLKHQLKELCRTNRDGSYSTQANRERMLDQMANQLRAAGFRRMQPQSLKPKHIAALVALWKDQSIGLATQKNRLSVLRWWAAKVGKANIIARDICVVLRASRGCKENE